MTLTAFTISLTARSGATYSIALFTIGYDHSLHFGFDLLPVWKDTEFYGYTGTRSLLSISLSISPYPVLWLQAGYRKFNSIQLPQRKPRPDELPF